MCARAISAPQKKPTSKYNSASDRESNRRLTRVYVCRWCLSVSLPLISMPVMSEISETSLTLTVTAHDCDRESEGQRSAPVTLSPLQSSHELSSSPSLPSRAPLSPLLPLHCRGEAVRQRRALHEAPRAPTVAHRDVSSRYEGREEHSADCTHAMCPTA